MVATQPVGAMVLANVGVVFSDQVTIISFIYFQKD